jgi:hypothetical protein
MTSTKPVTIRHGEESAAAAGPAGIPPYEISAWAADKTLPEIDAELDRLKDVARAEGQLLDHRFTTLEWLGAERRQLRGRSAADIAADLTPDESKAVNQATTAYYIAVQATRDARAAREAALMARLEAGQRIGASFPESKRRELAEAEQDAVDAVEDAVKAEGEALVKMHAIDQRVDVERQARRREAQAGINRAAFVANVAAAGGSVTSAELDRHYPTDGRIMAAVRRLTRRRRP